MARYLTLAAYTPEALATLVRNPQDRSAPVRQMMEGAGGRLLDFYHSSGEYHAVLINELPDDATLMSVGWASESVGHVKALKVLPLYTVEESMEALRKAGGIPFRGPGR